MDVFVKADSRNLPKLDYIMIMEYMKSSDKHNVAEIRGAKALMSSRDSYLETAVGFVEIKRCVGECTVRAKVVPEHKVSQKSYVVTAIIQEHDDTIKDTSCDGCPASAGGCKHTLVLLFWIEKKSSEPSPTSVICYWRKPKLSGETTNPIESKEVYRGIKLPKLDKKDPSILQSFREAAISKQGCSRALIMKIDSSNQGLRKYCLFDMMVEFTLSETDTSFENFKNVSTQLIYEHTRNEIEKKTVGQVNSKLWHGLRQGRITSSTIYNLAHCTTPDDSLVEQILGGYKVPESKAIKRGKELEKQILAQLSNQLPCEIRECGIYLKNGIMGASPEGVGENFIIEIKCPISEKTKTTYIKDGKITEHFEAQMNLEMLVAGKTKGLYCIADPKYEENGKIDTIWVDFRADLIENITQKAELFWKLHVYPKILQSAQ